MKRRLSHSSSALSYSGVILKRVPNINPEGINGLNQNSALPYVEVKGKWDSMKTRTVYGLIMIFGLYLILISGPIAIVSLIAVIQTLVFKEVISIAHSRSLEKKLPWFRSISW